MTPIWTVLALTLALFASAALGGVWLRSLPQQQLTPARPATRAQPTAPPAPQVGRALPPGEHGHLVFAEALAIAADLYLEECELRAASEHRAASQRRLEADVVDATSRPA
jgi:hypothetical protein